MFAIDHLRVRANQRDTQWIVNDMRNATWSVVDQRRWLFVREIKVSAAKNHLRQRAAVALGEAQRRAVHGNSANAATADAVFFDDYAEVLTFLLHDLLQGAASNRWYWQRWCYLFGKPKNLAVTDLLWQEAEHLPALIPGLMRENDLVAIWQSLSREGARQIIHKLPIHASLSSISASAAFTADPLSMVSIRRLFQRQRVILTDWAPALQGLPIDDSRMQLAAILTGLQLAPLLLIKYTPEVVAIFGEAVQCINVGLLPSIAHQDRHAIRIDGSQAELSRAASDPGSNGGMIENSNARPAQDRLGPASERGANRRDRVDSPSAPWVASSLVSRSDDRQQEHPARLLRASRQSTQKPPQEKIPRPTVEQPTQGLSSEPVMKFGIESTLLNQGFITSFGGFFYLINALNRAMSLQKDLLERLQAYDCPSAWLWLYGFGRSFRLDFDSSLLRFIARQCGFENLHLLLQQQSLPLVQMLFHQLCKIYGKEIWNQNLLQVSASVVSTPSHIDVFYPLATVRLDVRLAGLDINPAWVPWLGRVVTFHYREQMPGAATQPVPRE